MKNTIKKIGLMLAVVVIAMIFAVSVSALEPVGQCGDDVFWEYEANNGELVISGQGDMYNYEYFESPFHFADIKNLTISNNITSIGSNAFYDCTKLTSVTIGDDINYVGADAFHGCNMLSNVYINDLSNWCGIEFLNLFSNPLGVAENFYINGELVTDIIIPNGVKRVGSGAFLNFKKLKSIEIPNSVLSIGCNAFWNCESIKTLIIPDNVSSIEDNAFFSCKSLNNIELGDGLTSIGDYAFTSCEQLTDISIPNSVTNIGEYAFYNCKGMTSITLGNGLKTICKGAFDSCLLLKEITIPSSVKYLGEYAFYRCLSLERIVIENSNIDLSKDEICHTDFILKNISVPEYINLIKEYNEAQLSGDYERLEIVEAVIGTHYVSANMALPNLTIYGFDPSTAKNYAGLHNIPFKVIGNVSDEPSSPENPDTPEEPEKELNFFQKIAEWFRNLFDKLFGWLKF